MNFSRLESIQGDWHEFESKAHRREQQNRHKEAKKEEHQKEKEKRRASALEANNEREAKRQRPGSRDGLSSQTAGS
jgi:CTD kinase subunit alpha